MKKMYGRPRYILVLLYFALMFAYSGTKAYLLVTRVRLVTPAAKGWDFTARGDRLYISQLEPDPHAAGLRIGDEIAALNGDPVLDWVQLDAFFEGLKIGSSYSITVARDGDRESYTLKTASPPLYWWAEALATGVTPLIFFFSGLALFLLMPYNKQAVLFALFLGAAADPPGLPLLYHPSWWLLIPVVTCVIILNVAVAVLLQFSLNFPERSSFLNRHPRWEWYIYLPMLLFMAPFRTIYVPMQLAQPARTPAFPFPLLLTAAIILNLLYLLATLLRLGTSYRHSDQIGRSKLRVMVVGSSMALLASMTLLIAGAIDRLVNLGISNEMWAWSNATMFLTMCLAPPVWAYAIVRHQVIPVSLIVRRGVQYLLAKNALRILLALPIIGLLATILADPQRPLAEILFRNSILFYLLLAATIALGLVYRKRLADQIDRKFFREQYNQEQILHQLIDEVKHLDSIPEMSRQVTELVSAALHPEHVYLFYREEGGPNLSLSHTPSGPAEGVRVPEDFKLLHFMEMQGSAQEFPFPQKNNLPQTEIDWLARLQTRLIVPMSGMDNRISGLLVLGAKKSEIPYTAGDRQLLERLSDQIAIVYENVRLKQRTERDRQIRHEVLSRIGGQDFNILKECPRCGACYDSVAERCEADGSEVMLTLPVERTIDSRYRLDRLIGKGGMGAVYKAMDLRLNRTVAVKVLTGHLFGNRDALRRFEREAQASARLNHPNITTVYDYGVLSTEGAYLVMELIHGCTLGALIKTVGFVSPVRAAALFDQVLAGVAAAHIAGIVHRDLKPENVFIAKGEKQEDVIKILDFGLAKFALQELGGANNDEQSVTTPGSVMGTFGYMAPEQLTGGKVDERSDLFSVGVMVVETLTGRRPFSGKTYHEMLTNILQKPFRLAEQSSEARQLDNALHRCLARDAKDRYASAAVMRRDLIPAIRGCPPLGSSRQSESEAQTAILNSNKPTQD